MFVYKIFFPVINYCVWNILTKHGCKRCDTIPELLRAPYINHALILITKIHYQYLANLRYM